MSNLPGLYAKYFQKSRVFLYPLLQLPKGSGVTPIETYVRWEGRHHQNKQKFICVYHDRNDLEFKKIEKDRLEKHPLYESTLVVEGKKVIIFDFSKLEKDWYYFLNGEYSKLSYQSKSKISKYFGSKTEHSVYIDSYLYPHKYFDLYARLLDVKTSTIRTVGELCDRPNLHKETLTTKELVREINVRR